MSINSRVCTSRSDEEETCYCLYFVAAFHPRCTRMFVCEGVARGLRGGCAPGGEVESAGSTLSPLHLVAHSSSTTWAEGELWELAITLDQDCPRAASIRVRQGCAQCPILAETPWALSRGHRLEVAVTVSNGTLNGLKVMQS